MKVEGGRSQGEIINQDCMYSGKLNFRTNHAVLITIQISEWEVTDLGRESASLV